MLLWALLWAVLLVGAGLVLGLLGRTLWRKVKALTRELGESSQRLTGLLARLDDPADPGGHQPEPTAAARASVSGDRRGRARR